MAFVYELLRPFFTSKQNSDFFFLCVLPLIRFRASSEGGKDLSLNINECLSKRRGNLRRCAWVRVEVSVKDRFRDTEIIVERLQLTELFNYAPKFRLWLVIAALWAWRSARSSGWE